MRFFLISRNVKVKMKSFVGIVIAGKRAKILIKIKTFKDS